MPKKKNEVEMMVDVVAGMMRSLGVEKAQFADDDDGTVHGEIIAKPKAKRLAPLKGFGDTVKRGDRVIVTMNYRSKPPFVEFDGKPVTIKDYSLDGNDPWMVVEREHPGPKEGPSSFNYHLDDHEHRTFKKVK